MTELASIMYLCNIFLCLFRFILKIEPDFVIDIVTCGY